MALKPYNDKLNGRTFAIGISKRIPEDSANLSYISAPKITSDNISVVNEHSGAAVVAQGGYDLYRANDDFLLESGDGVSTIPSKNILVTDEFTTKELPSDIPEPLYYVANLKSRIKAVVANRDVLKNSVPYQYGYETRTLEQIKNANRSNDKNDITPLIRVLDIIDENGIPVTGGYKVRLIKDTATAADAYEVRIYNNFDRDVTYKATYRTYDGTVVTEVINSNPLFSRVDKSEVEGADFMENKYAIEKTDNGYLVYAPTQMYKVTDENRTPFEFRYKLLASLEANYNKSNPVEIKAGVLYLDGNVSGDTRAIIPSFIHELGSSLPDYMSFINPHPPVSFWADPKLLDDPMEYLGAQEYWDVNLTAPQHYINDYDFIIITGYGTHDLSVYNTVLKNYLMQGGKIIIDNLSNDGIELLSLDFGAINPILNYEYEFDGMEPVLMTAAKQFIHEGKYKTRYYDLTNANPNRIAYFDSSNMQVGPQVSLSPDDMSSWTDIISYTSSNISIGYKSYNNRGRMYFSNCGILKAFAQKPTDEVKKFMANMILAMVENKWVSTPWTYDRVYHIDQLYEEEIQASNYIYDISLDNKTIAKKIISSKAKNLLGLYTNSYYYNFAGTYYVDAEEYVDRQWKTLTRVYVPTSLQPEEPLYAYAINPNGSNFSIDDLQGYSKSDVNVYNDDITFKFTVRPYTYVWRNVGGDLVQYKEYGSGYYAPVIEATISKADGLVNLGLLASMIPELPGGQEWTDPNNIFFEVITGEYIGGDFDASEQRVNLRIYDKATGEYKYTSDGDNVITYADLYSPRNVLTSNGRYVLRRKSEDIIVQASTSYYILTANKRTFAVLEKQEAKFEIKMPTNLNTNESWYPRIRNINFTKNSFNKDDYDRISKTLGFKFEKDYIVSRIREFYGENPDDDVVANILAKLDGDDSTLSEEDAQIIAEAFVLIESDLVYEYEMIEYHKQPWNPVAPYKLSRNETPAYINQNTIQVQHPNMYIFEGTVREELERVSPTMYKSTNTNWAPAKPIALEVEDINEIGGWRTLDPSTYEVDFANGMATLLETEDLPIYATYSRSNIDILKKIYVNAIVNMQRLDKLDAHYYDIPHMNILANPVPKVYLQDDDAEPRMISATEYSIDYERGYLKLNNPTPSNVLMSYSYAQTERLTIKDFDLSRGLIELNEGISFNDAVGVTYFYEDLYYDYKGYFDGEKYHYLDLNPTRGHVSTVPVVEGENIVYKEVPTYDLLNKNVYFYMMPWRITKDGTIIKENTSTVRHTFDKEELQLLQLAHPEIIVIGSIKITNDYTVYDVIGLDTRVRGGGLKEAITRDMIEKTDALSLNFWDISEFDGLTYYSNGIVVIKLPKTILDIFTEEEVEKIVDNHLAFGVLPIIKYY